MKPINMKKLLDAKKNLETCEYQLKMANQFKERWPRDAERAEKNLETAKMVYADTAGTVLPVLDAAQSRAKTRTITVDQICESAFEIEDTFGVAKSRLHGVSVLVDVHAQKYPNSYKFIPESTQFTMENRRGVWYLTAIRRDTTGRRAKRIIVTNMPEETKQAIIERCMAL